MNASLITLWTRIRESYWFLPSLMAVAAVLLSLVATQIDAAIGSEWLAEVNWLYANKPDGARAVLSTVAGSMITVAGVTFSMTILSISQASSQVGPRLLNNFMRDTSNQFTLGVFIATFLYCLMVLRTVRNGDSPPPGAETAEDLTSAFVPHVAIMIALLMTVFSVGVLIFFFHHIPETIHVSNIVAGVGKQLNSRIDEQFPDRIGSPAEEASQRGNNIRLPDSFFNAATPIKCGSNGYIEYIDSKGLMELARSNDLVIRLRFRSGDFATAGNVLMLASPGEKVDDQVRTDLQGTVILGSQRTDTQDIRFMINQLVEVAIRALSPGVNDPFTAQNCMDWLQAAIEELSDRKLPDPHRFDDDQNLRVVAKADTFDSLLGIIFDQMRQYVAADGNAAVHMMEMLTRVAAKMDSRPHQMCLVRHAQALRQACVELLPEKRRLRTVIERNRQLLKLVRQPEYRFKMLENEDWIGGRA